MRYIVGIDLGTTNSALAYVDPQAAGDDPAAAITVMPVPQLVAPSETALRRLLPSSAYLPGEHELPAGALRLPWGEPQVAVGELAKRQGARIPGRLVSSAKSWLCHAGVDRTAAILPWGAAEGVARISPIQASSLFLQHLRDAWDHRFPRAPLGAQDVVLTVPASFDEVARELTVQAAREAGLQHLTLLEEPQAAFYSFTATQRGQLDEMLGPARGGGQGAGSDPAGRRDRLVLVCDVGGGTTDFSLIHVAPGGSVPVLRRLAVGDHILLGGDNMDAALARRVEARLGVRLDAARYAQLVQACRQAKEVLLAPGGPERTGVAVAGRGSKLVAGTLAAELTRDEVLEVVLDGFFPRSGPGELPVRQRGSGLLELGLPYAADPAVTRHAAAFLRSHAAAVQQALERAPDATDLPRPDAVLLNGGVFTPPTIGARLLEVIGSWFEGGAPPTLLANDELEVAVARGAAYYGLVRRGIGLRIGGGTARAYFIGIDAPGAAKQALCLIPRHLEEQVEVEVPRTFALRLDRPVRFPLYATTQAQAELPGELLPLDEDLFVALPPIQTVLRLAEPKAAGARQGPGGAELPVRLRASLTELGTMELWCAAQDGSARWKLEFQVRGTAAAGNEEGLGTVAPMPKKLPEARELVELVYGKRPAPVDKGTVKGLVRRLEQALGPRADWPTPLVRELWASLWAGQGKRRRTADHERIWCSLTGFCLRPGFGTPLDGWRAAETWKVFDQGLQFVGEPHNWEAWWVLWRRIAGGLDGAAQQRLFDFLAAQLGPAAAGKAGQAKKVKAGGRDEMVRLLASLERIGAAAKLEAGGWIFNRLQKEGSAPHLLWAIGRLGARVPFYGSGHTCLPVDAAETWVERLLALPPRQDGLTFALLQLARVSGDRSRDLDPELRERVARQLVAGGAPAAWVRMVREVVELSGSDEQRVFGESLPAGLRLLPVR